MTEKKLEFKADVNARKTLFESCTSQNTKKLLESSIKTGAPFLYVQWPNDIDEDKKNLSVKKRSGVTNNHQSSMFIVCSRPDVMDLFDRDYKANDFDFICGNNVLYDILNDKSGKRLNEVAGIRDVGSSPMTTKMKKMTKIVPSKQNCINTCLFTKIIFTFFSYSK
jgi:hypothetical protein